MVSSFPYTGMRQGTFDKRELARDTLCDIVELLAMMWPPAEGERNIEKELEEYRKDDSLTLNKSILIWDGDLLIGHTEIFNREIGNSQRTMKNMALANVCVRPGYRGNHYGLELVRTAFDFVNGRQFECSVFQTDVPDFYRKFGCIIITNEFFNSLDPEDPDKNPWWNQCVMVYPGDFDIGKDKIDMNGKGY